MTLQKTAVSFSCKNEVMFRSSGKKTYVQSSQDPQPCLWASSGPQWVQIFTRTISSTWTLKTILLSKMTAPPPNGDAQAGDSCETSEGGDEKESWLRVTYITSCVFFPLGNPPFRESGAIWSPLSKAKLSKWIQQQFYLWVWKHYLGLDVDQQVTSHRSEHHSMRIHAKNWNDSYLVAHPT